MQRAIIAHILLGIPAALFLIAAIIMGVLKLAEVGMGPGLPWSSVAGFAVIGVCLLAVDAVVAVRAAGLARSEFMKNFDPPFFDR